MSRSLPESGTALLHAWPASALAVWAAAWRAGAASPDDVVHTLHDYAQAHELDAAPDSGVASGSALDLVQLVGRATASAVVLPAAGDAQGLPPGLLTEEVLAAGEVLLLAYLDGQVLTVTARGTAELGDTVHLRGPVITGTVTAPAGVSEEI